MCSSLACQAMRKHQYEKIYTWVAFKFKKGNLEERKKISISFLNLTKLYFCLTMLNRDRDRI